ncbi:MAG: PilZ domain-containing protein [Synergistaceae bacterium]|nr:PilZ domain-containing protein [Synergistaceae bacterium]
MAKEENENSGINYSYKLKHGLKGEIVINAGVYRGRYPSRVEEAMTDGLVGLAYPLFRGALLPLYRDLDFTFIFEDGGALYVFDMAVRKVDTQSGNVPLMWAAVFGDPKRVQRRQFLRVSCPWDVMAFHVEWEARSPMSTHWMDGRALDISLGGIRFKIIDENADGHIFESGERVFVRFPLAGRQNFQLGRASRVVHVNGAWEIGIGFDSLPNSVERKLFEFIRQQEMTGRSEK